MAPLSDLTPWQLGEGASLHRQRIQALLLSPPPDIAPLPGELQSEPNYRNENQLQ